MRVYDFLTLTDRDASALVDVFQGYLFEAQSSLPANTVLLLQLEDSVNLEGTDERWQTNGNELRARIAALSNTQADVLLEAIGAFWAEPDDGLGLRERLSKVGLV